MFLVHDYSGSGGFVVGSTADAFAGKSPDGMVEGGGLTFGQDTGESLFGGLILGYLFIPFYDPFTPITPNSPNGPCHK